MNTNTAVEFIMHRGLFLDSASFTLSPIANVVPPESWHFSIWYFEVNGSDQRTLFRCNDVALSGWNDDKAKLIINTANNVEYKVNSEIIIASSGGDFQDQEWIKLDLLLSYHLLTLKIYRNNVV